MSRLLRAAAALATAITLILCAPAFEAGAAARGLEVLVDVSSQRMYVTENGRRVATWPVSTGRRGYRTPRGTYRPTFLSRHHRSRRYNNAPMPHSVFFHRGYAIHGTNAVSRLGRPASHGCVRLAPSHARRLFNMVRRHGRGGTVIRIRT